MAVLEELGIASRKDVRSVRPLTGGVASDIAVIDLGERRVCIKFALPKLRVAADWRAPVHRNAAEYAWLEVASRVAPDCAVRLFGRSPARHGFAMEYLDGTGVYLWKAALLAGRAGVGEAATVANLIGRIHAASSEAAFDRSPFHNRDDFHALRIEPYLSYTRSKYPDLSEALLSLETMLFEGNKVLVHGDASPKNILIRDGLPILLDAECATIGDASFDPAFCLNHLVLKALHLPKARVALLSDVLAFWDAYAPHICWEDPGGLERRVCGLLPALMLARVDGKSPVEYLSDDEQQRVRELAIPLISVPVEQLEAFVARMAEGLGKA